MICPIIVAAAAPAMPISNPKIRIGSRMQFKTAPESVENIAYFGLPSARINWLAPVPKMAKGKLRARIRVYSMAYSKV